MGGESLLHPGSLPACFAGSLLLFLETSFFLLFGASDLALGSPEFSAFYLNHKVLLYGINQVVFSPLSKESFYPFILLKGIDDNGSPNLQIPRWLALGRSVGRKEVCGRVRKGHQNRVWWGGQGLRENRSLPGGGRVGLLEELVKGSSSTHVS